MHRPTLGVLALLFLGGGILGIVLENYVYPGAIGAFWPAGAIRIGAAFGALWLAHPQLDRLPRILWIGIVVLAVVVARWKYLLPTVAVILVLLAVLRPRRR